MGPFILIDGLLKYTQQCFGINRGYNYSGMESRLVVPRVELTKVDNELMGIVTDLKVIGIPPFQRRGFLIAIVTRLHQKPQLLRLGPWTFRNGLIDITE
jgi:hypothetical protein